MANQKYNRSQRDNQQQQRSSIAKIKERMWMQQHTQKVKERMWMQQHTQSKGTDVDATPNTIRHTYITTHTHQYIH